LSLLQGRTILFVAIAGLLAIMGGIVYYASLDNPQLERIEIELTDVEIIDVNNIENQAKLQTTFLVKNPGEKTFTVAIISYELFVNDNSIGTGQYSTADIAMPGRAAFYPGSEIPLKNIFQLILTDTNASEYRSIIEGESVKYTVKGIVTVENAWSLVEKEFDNSIELS
jgi:LEA14-like dessication related protein